MRPKLTAFSSDLRLGHSQSLQYDPRTNISAHFRVDKLCKLLVDFKVPDIICRAIHTFTLR